MNSAVAFFVILSSVFGGFWLLMTLNSLWSKYQKRPIIVKFDDGKFAVRMKDHSGFFFVDKRDCNTLWKKDYADQYCKVDTYEEAEKILIKRFDYGKPYK